MKYIIVLALLLTAACSFVVSDSRTPAEASATRTAKPIQPLYEPVLRIVLERPPIDIAPAVGVPDWTYTVTPTPKASE